MNEPLYPEWRVEELAHKYAPADAYDRDEPDHYPESDITDISTEESPCYE